MLSVLVLLIMSQKGPVSSQSVTFENPDPCALKGSSVVLRCSYHYEDGQTVRRTMWYKGFLRNGIWSRIKLSEVLSYENRTEYLGDLQHNCSLVIHDLQDNDTGYYYLRFDTNTYGWHSKGSVHLSLTELSASVKPQRVRAGDSVTLQCTTSCQLPSTVWFRDGHPVAKPEFLAQAGDSGNYSCAVDGQESDPVALDVQYPPVNVSIEVTESHPGRLVEGSSVNLTCSSVANPAADNYTWYRAAASSPSSVLQVGSGQVLALPSVDVSHAGLYLCRARNSVGENSSAGVLLTIPTDTAHVILHVGIIVKAVIVVLIPLVIVCVWVIRRKCKEEEKDDIHDYENISRV